MEKDQRRAQAFYRVDRNFSEGLFFKLGFPLS
jgi:hypothetical protein